MLNTATCLDGSSFCCCCTPFAVSTGADAVKLSHGGPCDVCMDNLGYQSIGEGFSGRSWNVCASFHGEHDELHRLDCEKFSECAFFRQPCVQCIARGPLARVKGDTSTAAIASSTAPHMTSCAEAAGWCQEAAGCCQCSSP